MLQIIKLFLPVIFPSWRFFSAIGPSPRIEYSFVSSALESPLDYEWRPLSFLPLQVSWKKSLWRFVHNPHWNEQLYLNTCAEQLFEEYSEFFDQEIGRRLCTKVATGELVAPVSAVYLVYRLRAVHAYEALPANNTAPREEITFASQPFHIECSNTLREDS